MSRETSVDHDALLRRHGVQVTAQRLAVLRTVSDRPHSTADDIYTVVRAEIGAISLQSVYDALGGPKAYVTVSCGSHELVYEKQHTKVLQASAEWLRFGTYEGREARDGPPTERTK